MAKFEVISSDKDDLKADLRELSKRFNPEVIVKPLSFSSKSQRFVLQPGPDGDGTVLVGRATRMIERVGTGAFDDLGEHKSIRVLSFMGYEVYCHLIIDALPILLDLEKNSKESLVIVKQCDLLDRMIKDIGLKFNKVKFIKKTSYVKAKNVFFHLHQMQHTRTVENVKYLKEKVDKAIGQTKGTEKIIYCTRNSPGRGAKHGRKMEVRCEKRIISILRRFCGENGFEFVYFTGYKKWTRKVKERMSFMEQMELFNSAKAVIGPHGGAMVNILGMQYDGGGKVCEFTSGTKVPCQGKRSLGFGKNYNKLLAFFPETFLDYYMIPFTEGSTEQECLIDFDHLRKFLEKCL